MLGSIDPIIIFQIYKLIDVVPVPPAPTIPLASDKAKQKKVTFAVIPIYLSEELTGVFIDSEAKNIDIDTNTDSLSSGEAALVNQKALGSVTTVNLVAKRGSVGLTILLALAEQIIDKVTSQEYEVTYMHGAVTVFGGLIHGFSVDQGTDNDLYKIKLELSRGRPKTKSVEVDRAPEAERAGTEGLTAPANAPTFSGSSSAGKSVIQPNVSTVRP